MPARQRKAQLDPNTTEGALAGMVPDTTFRAVTPSDTVNIKDGPARSLYVGTAGTVVAINENNNPVSFVGVPAGTILPIVTKRVNSTNTTASNIVAL